MSLPTVYRLDILDNRKTLLEVLKVADASNYRHVLAVVTDEPRPAEEIDTASSPHAFVEVRRGTGISAPSHSDGDTVEVRVVLTVWRDPAKFGNVAAYRILEECLADVGKVFDQDRGVGGRSFDWSRDVEIVKDPLGEFAIGVLVDTYRYPNRRTG